MTPPGSDVARPIPGSGHDYIHLLAETVNPANGSLSINIGLPTPAGRGISLPYSITYNSGAVHHLVSGYPGVAQYVSSFNTEMAQGGWGNTLPYVAAAFWQVGVPAPAHNTGYCTIGSNYVFYDPSGESHPLGLANVSYFGNGSGGPVNPDYCSTVATNYYAGGDDEVRAQSFAICNGVTTTSGSRGCNVASAPFTVTDKNGTVYTFPYILTSGAGVGRPAQIAFAYPYTIEDRNGNIIAINSSYGFNTSPPQFLDTLGRQLVTKSTGPGNSEVDTVGELNYTISYTTSTANFTAPAQVTKQPESSNVSCSDSFTVPSTGQPGIIGDTGVSNVIQSITLPNGKQYVFKYESTFGLVNEIDYPDGGWVKYTWDFNDTMSDYIQYVGSDGSGAPSGLCNVEYKTPVIKTRTVGFTPGSTAQTQSFTYNTVWIPQTFGSQWSSKTTTVTTVDNVTGNSAAIVYTYGSVPTPNGDTRQPSFDQTPVETSIQYYPWGVTPGPGVATLRTVNKTWNDPFQMSSEQTIENGASTETVYCYTGTYITEEDVYDYGVASPSLSQGGPQAYSPPVTCGQLNPTRKTIYTYQSFVPASILPQDPTYGQSGMSTPLPPIFQSGFIKPCQVIMYDGSGNRAAETDLYYDGATSNCGSPGASTLAGVANLPYWRTVDSTNYTTHDEALFGPTSVNPRGNLTSMVKWSNAGTPSTTTYTYDETGQVTSITDPCGNASCGDMTGTNHKTTYSYIDNPVGGNAGGQSNAYVTQIVNNLAQQTSFAYNYVTGSLTSSKDPNGQSTVYGYNDSLNRLTGITYSDGGNVTIHYNDTASSSPLPPSCPSSPSSSLPSAPSVTTSQFLSSTEGTKTTVALRDGMGHVVQTQLTSDPNGTDCVDTVYNGMGQAKSVSNPYRSTPSPSTDGITTFTYDALGRSAAVSHPDLSTLQWLYSGNATTYINENGNSWVRTMDALGRLTGVVEPSGASTSYTYNAMGDLLTVKQPGLTGETSRANRSFTYDSLSRLVCASNPENSSSQCPVSATTALPSGVIGYTYDLNGNVANKIDARGITISYQYDPLNRVMSKQYSGGSFATPSSCFIYDTGSSGGVANSVGRVVQEWTQNGPCSPPPSVSNTLTQRSILGYDAMGRVLTEQRCILANCKVSGTPFSITRTYDYAGNLQTYDNGLGTLTITNTYDSANRLFQVGSSANDAMHPPSLYYVSGFMPFGTPQNSALGGNLSITQTYDKRLRSTGLSAVKQ